MRPIQPLLLIAGICAIGATARAADAPATLACSDEAGARHVALRKDGKDLRFRAAADAWIEIVESRQTIAVAGENLEQTIEIPLPLRFGSHWLHARRGAEFTLSRFYPGTGDGSVAITMHCSPSATLQRRLHWLEQSGAVAAHGQSQAEADQVAALIAAARALADGAEGASDAALAQHLVAQTLTANGREADATEAFAAAESAWAKAGNPDGALAAHLGRVDALQRSGALQAAIDATQPPSSLSANAPYLLVRTEQSRCLSLQSIGRLDEAEQCYRWILSRYERLGEPSDYAVALQAYASLKRDRGDFDAAQRLFEESIRRAVGPYAPWTRGRNRVWLADMALRRGAVADALQQLNAALPEFIAYRSTRWQGNVFMKLADLYGELGSYEEAYAALAQAVQRFNARDSLPRLANAMMSFADLERHAGHTLSAFVWSSAAAAMFRRLNMPSPADSARALVAALRFDLALPYAASEVPAIESVPPDDAGKWRIVRARIALRQGRLDAARDELEQLARTPLSLSERVQATVLVAEEQAAAGDHDAARTTLIDAATRIDQLAQRARSDVLRYVIARQIVELRRFALRLALEQTPPDAAIPYVWRWLALDADDPSTPTSASHAHDDAFDRAVASELLPGSAPVRSGDSRSQRELLARLAGPEDESAARAQSPSARVLSLAELQARLPADAVFVAYVDGGARGALLWLSRDEARLAEAAAPEQVRADAAALQAASRVAGASQAEVQDAARALAGDLFERLGVAAPHRLFVLSDAMSRAIPWSALAWPGATAPLVETTAVTTLRLSRMTPAAARAAAPADLRVVVAAQRDAAVLPALAGAEAEAEQIRAASTGRDIRVVTDAHATRDGVDRALAEPGGWVHVAAHGVAEPQRIGYAGLWLEPVAPETTPAFLSWIDVLDRGVRSDLVVLDACQTGDSGTAVNGNLSFADAVARAGARRVVAVMWPVSDAAAATWVPAFYTALLADPTHDVAEALRSAQQRLRASRAFAHPFYWAGMQAIERWPIGSATR